MPRRIPVVGQIEFLNVWPIERGWRILESAYPASFTYQRSVAAPSQLNQAWDRGEIDWGPCSAQYWLEHKEELRRHPELNIWSEGPVASVLLIRPERAPWPRHPRVLLSATSRTSNAMVDRLLRDQHPEYVLADSPTPDLLALASSFDGMLVIGDTALTARRLAARQRWVVWDVARWWRQVMGVPAVFAVWVSRLDLDRAIDKVLLDRHLAALEWGMTGLTMPDGSPLSPWYRRYWTRNLQYIGSPWVEQGLRVMQETLSDFGTWSSSLETRQSLGS